MKIFVLLTIFLFLFIGCGEDEDEVVIANFRGVSCVRGKVEILFNAEPKHVYG